MADKEPKTIEDLTIPKDWPEHYKKDYIKNRLHGTSKEYLNDNEEIIKGKVVAKPFVLLKVEKTDCPVCNSKDSFVLEPGVKAHHCGKCGYWDEKELKAYHDKINKIGELKRSS